MSATTRRTPQLVRHAAGAALLAAAALPLAPASAQQPPAAAPAAGAAQQGSNVEAKSGSEAASPVAQLALADRLYALGVERDDPVMVLAAARLAQSVPTREVARTPQEGAQAMPADARAPSVMAMVQKARDMAKRDPQLAALAQQALEGPDTASRGRVGGAGITNSYVRGGGSVTYFGNDSRFYGQELAAVRLAGDGNADLDLYVYDASGNLICSREGTSAYESCAWTPRWTDTFRIVVRNASPVGSAFAMATN